MFTLLLMIATSGEAQQKDVAVERARRYEPLIVAASIKHRVDPRLLWTVAYLETRFQPREVSPKGARGLMQLMPATAARFGVKNIFDPEQNIHGAAQYLRFLLDLFDGNVSLALAGYNAGEGTVEAFRSGRRLLLSNGKVINPKGIKSTIPPYRETVNYVTNGAQVFRMLVRTGYFSGDDLARLRNIETPKEEELATLVTVDLEEMPADIVDLKKGSVYAVEESPTLPAKSPATRSVYVQ
jgi:hypothetical protein